MILLWYHMMSSWVLSIRKKLKGRCWECDHSFHVTATIIRLSNETRQPWSTKQSVPQGPSWHHPNSHPPHPQMIWSQLMYPLALWRSQPIPAKVAMLYTAVLPSGVYPSSASWQFTDLDGQMINFLRIPISSFRVSNSEPFVWWRCTSPS